MWLNGWSSAWEEPEPHSPIPRAAKSCAVRLDPKFAKNATSMELTSLPEDVLARLIKMILLGDGKGSRFARTCMTSKKLCIEVMTSLVLDGVAWWTGSGKPYRPLPVPDPKEDPMCSGWRLHKAAMNLKMCVVGMDEGDIARILTGWFTNFSIDSILFALGCPIVLSGGSYVARPVEGMLVLSAQLGGLANPWWGGRTQWAGREGSAMTIAFPRTAFWGRDDVHDSINSASILIIPLNIGGNHWVVARVVKVRHHRAHACALTCTEHSHAHAHMGCLTTPLMRVRVLSHSVHSLCLARCTHIPPRILMCPHSSSHTHVPCAL